MPKKSAAALAIVQVTPPRLRLDPPKGLSRAAGHVFRHLTNAVAPEHFTAADVPLLVEFCRAVELADQAALELHRHGAVVNGKASPWLVVQEKAQRALVALSARLRLAPQSRFDRTTAGTRSRGGARTLDFNRLYEGHDDDSER